jgi:hypothetical protein
MIIDPNSHNPFELSSIFIVFLSSVTCSGWRSLPGVNPRGDVIGELGCLVEGGLAESVGRFPMATSACAVEHGVDFQ